MTPTLSRPDRLIAASLFALTFFVLLATEQSVGFVRDESTYFHAGSRYASWYAQLVRSPGHALRDETIAGFFGGFGNNFEHPVLMKTAFGLSERLFADTLGWLRPATAARLPAFAAAGLIPLLIYLLGLRLHGRSVALFAAVSFFFVPRHFFHAHLAAFDVPIAAMWLLVVYAFHRAQTEPRWWWLTGVAFGLALATKHNAFFLPIVLVPFAWARAHRLTTSAPEARTLLQRFVGLHVAVALLFLLLYVALTPANPPLPGAGVAERIGFVKTFQLLSPHTLLYVALVGLSGWLLRALHRVDLPTFRALAPITAMVVLGPAILYLHWPWLWHHPVERLAAYLEFHARHEHYAWLYLGELLRGPPFPLAYVLVKTALTVPLSLLVPMATGAVALLARIVASAVPALRGRLAPLTFGELLVAVNAAASIALISLPWVPHFGGVKHWLPSMPFLALLAGVAVVRSARVIASRVAPARSPRVELSLAVLLLCPALVATARIHPYGTSAYSELAGGVPGAASLGMQRQYWSNNVTGVLGWINEHAPRGARVWLHEVTWRSFDDYQENGMLRRDLVRVDGPRQADVAAYQYHQEFREQEFDIWQAFASESPVYGLYVDETPQVVVYLRP